MKNTNKTKKLIVLLGTVACAGVIASGIAACTQHTHTFDESVWKNDASGHWHAPTCEHTEEKGSFAAHVDADNNCKCDVCNYDVHKFDTSQWGGFDNTYHWHLATCEHTDVKGDLTEHTYDADYNCTECGASHVHTFDESKWEKDGDSHWHPSTCGHDVKGDEAPHVDEEGGKDEYCDVCAYELPHEFSTEWSFDESTHWHQAVRHPGEIKDETSHTFENGLCKDCGVKEIDTKVYAVYSARESEALNFSDWQSNLKEEGITRVDINTMGDVYYYTSDEDYTVKYVADRTVKVHAYKSDSSEGLANVWFKVVSETSSASSLAVKATDENGVAEFSFTPSSYRTYYIMPAEAKDLVQHKVVESEEDARPFPNRYTPTQGMASAEYAVRETANTEEEYDANFEYAFSQSWNAYNKVTLPYTRACKDYTDPNFDYTNPENIVETGREFKFTTEGTYYDYFYFYPASHYKPGNTLEQTGLIIANVQRAAMGYYTISFECSNDANVKLFFWNENGVILDAHYDAKNNPEGVPQDKYITSASGTPNGESYADKCTGKNEVQILVTDANALQDYCLGLLADKPCEITFTVTRTDDYEIPQEVEYEFNGSETQIEITDYSSVLLNLKDVSAGDYTLTFTPDDNPEDSTLVSADRIKAQVGYGAVTSLWKSSATVNDTKFTNQTKGTYEAWIHISESSEFIRISNESRQISGKISMAAAQPLTLEALGATTAQHFPVNYVRKDGTGKITDQSDEIPVQLSSGLNGVYKLVVLAVGNCGAYLNSITAKTNSQSVNLSTLNTLSDSMAATPYTVFSAYVNLTEADTAIYFTRSIDPLSDKAFTNSMIMVTLTKVEGYEEVDLDTHFTINLKDVSKQQKNYIFIAPQAGTYKIDLDSTNGIPCIEGDSESVSLQNWNVQDIVTSDYIIEKTTDTHYSSDTNHEYLTKHISGTFELAAGEALLFKIKANSGGKNYTVNNVDGLITLAD